jgi:hypothetical protein
MNIYDAIKTLRPGDAIGYEGYELVRWFTNGRAGHVAVYWGMGFYELKKFIPDVEGGPVVITADPHIGGVGFTALDDVDEIVWIRRPRALFDITAALTTIQPYLGKPYSWSNSLNDAGLWAPSNGGLNCSHTSALVMQGGGCPQFDPEYNLAQIEPAHFETTYQSTEIWKR